MIDNAPIMLSTVRNTLTVEQEMDTGVPSLITVCTLQLHDCLIAVMQNQLYSVHGDCMGMRL